jgi:hypothetical protein
LIIAKTSFNSKAPSLALWWDCKIQFKISFFVFFSLLTCTYQIVHSHWLDYYIKIVWSVKSKLYTFSYGSWTLLLVLNLCIKNKFNT